MIAYIGNNPGSCSEWASLSAVYQEYRVLGLTVQYTPNFASYSTSSTPLLGGQLVLSTFRNVVLSLPGSYADAIALQPYSLRSITQANSLTVRMNADAGSATGWFNSSGPAVTNAVVYFATGLDISKTYGLFTIRYLVQFKSPA
jgi:hypothetical protein